MPHLTINDLIRFAASPNNQADEMGRPYVYIETGRYKPFHPSIRKTAERRGFRVIPKCKGVFYAYPPPSIALQNSVPELCAALRAMLAAGEYHFGDTGWPSQFHAGALAAARAALAKVEE